VAASDCTAEHGRVRHPATGRSISYGELVGQVPITKTLTADDTLYEGGVPLLSRALGTSHALDVSVSSIDVASGDVIVLMAHRVPGELDRHALIAHVERSREHVLVVRFDEEDRAIDENLHLDKPPREWRVLLRSAIALALAVLMFVTALAWAQ